MKTVTVSFLVVIFTSAVALGLVAPSPLSAGQSDLRADVNLVSIYFSVRDKRDRLVTDLTRDTFKVSEDGRAQEISFFAHHTDAPLNLGVLLDTSTSLARTLGLEADAASSFFKTVMRTNDQGFLISYATRVETLQVPTEDADRLSTKAQSIRSKGRIDDVLGLPQRTPPPASSPFPGRFPMPMPAPPSPTIPDPASLRSAHLYDAVVTSVERFLSREAGRKAIVVAALADDAGSESTLRDALKTLKQSDVIAYVLEVQHAPRRNQRDDCDIRHIFRNEDEYRIARLAVETGGRVIKVEGFEKMQAAFEQIAEELHHQYSLGYRPSNQNWDGAFRKVSIDAGKGYKVAARDGYYAKPKNGH
jgi:VWFA-related protein